MPLPSTIMELWKFISLQLCLLRRHRKHVPVPFFAIPYEIFQEKCYSDILPEVTILIYQFGDIKKFLILSVSFARYKNEYTTFLYKVPNFEADLNVLN